MRLITVGRVGGVNEQCEQSESVRMSEANGLFVSGFQLLMGCVGLQCLQIRMQEKELFTLLDVTRRKQGNC